jgi:RHS repeat-associated protein
LVGIVTKNSSNAVIERIEYTYDVYDRRIAKSVDTDGNGVKPAEVERYVHDGENLALVFDGNGNLTERFLYGVVVDQVLAQDKGNGAVLWGLADNLGSIRLVTDSQGNVVNEITYDAFGNVVLESNGNVEFRFGYTGRELDAETGDYYYRSRYYDSTIGRFVSEDTIGFEGGDANLYRYVFNSPTNYTDPTGFQAYSGSYSDDYSTERDSERNNDGGLLAALFAIFALSEARKADSAKYYDFGRSAGEEAGKNATFDVVSPDDVAQGTPPFVSRDPSLRDPFWEYFSRGDREIENACSVPPFLDFDSRSRVEVEGFPAFDEHGLFKPYWDINHWDTGKNARELRKNMERKGEIFDVGDNAHHIVPSTDSRTKEAKELRATLEKYKIDVNDADNGVRLTKKEHNGVLHRKATYEKINQELKLAADEKEARKILKEIGKEIQNGTFLNTPTP